ncbi:MAG TPA: hypothetical protein EYP06_01510 [Desulfobacterales bacterium]|nr:hypothetical protein [Desulfobacterales bacterium]
MRKQKTVKVMMRARNMPTGVRVSNVRVRRRRLSLTRFQVFMIIVLLLVFMGSGIGFVWSNFESTQRGYDIAQLKERERKLRDLNRKLKLELAYLRSPQNLETVAIKRLGLVQPRAEQIVVLP